MFFHQNKNNIFPKRGGIYFENQVGKIRTGLNGCDVLLWNPVPPVGQRAVVSKKQSTLGSNDSITLPW